MQLGLVGLGKMGANMRDRLRAAGIDVVGYALSPGNRDVDSLAELIDRLSAPRTVWVMVPVGDPTRDTVAQLAGLLAEGDVVV
ncbi:MAG: NAD(P)-binding domain-containing protein, partial [Pseudonocardiaceae bacterium]